MDYFSPDVKSRCNTIAASLTVALLAFYILALIVHYQTALPPPLPWQADDIHFQAGRHNTFGERTETESLIHWTPYDLDLTANIAPALEIANGEILLTNVRLAETAPAFSATSSIRSRDPPEFSLRKHQQTTC